jgi:ABC-type Fe3+/spermidine/putrescine transport system ATPase subunit
MLVVSNLSFAYAQKNILENVNFSLKEGNVLAIMGESGCGKSTLLKLLYGLYDSQGGQILWKNQEVLGPKFNLVPGMEDMKYLAQDFDLMPFITVAENIGKYLSNFYPEAKAIRIQELLEIVGMEDFAQTKAKFLSGGQLQRVALARALALAPGLLILDEPFSHIDNFKKNKLRRQLFTYIKSSKITCVLATHDSGDVLSFADQLIIIKEGKIINDGSPKEIYTQPDSEYTAALFGECNTLMGSDWGMASQEKIYVFPHQLAIADRGVAVVVKDSFFKGANYMIAATYQKSVIFFENQSALDKGIQVFLKLK